MTPQRIICPLSTSNQVQDADHQIFEVNDHLSTLVHTHGLDTSFHSSMESWVALDQITDVQHPLSDVDQANSGELHDLHCIHGFDWTDSLISVTAVAHSHRSFRTFGQGQPVLQLCCQVRLMDEHRHFSVLRSLHQSRYSPFESPVAYVSDKSAGSMREMSPRESIMLSRHNNSIFTIFRRKSRFNDQVQCALNYSWTLYIE